MCEGKGTVQEPWDGNEVDARRKTFRCIVVDFIYHLRFLGKNFNKKR